LEREQEKENNMITREDIEIMVEDTAPDNMTEEEKKRWVDAWEYILDKTGAELYAEGMALNHLFNVARTRGLKEGEPINTVISEAEFVAVFAQFDALKDVDNPGCPQ
jgi:hypothetical protein